MPVSDAKAYHTPKDVAERFGVSESVVWNWLNSRELAGTDVSRSGSKKKRWQISTAAIKAFEAARTSGKTVVETPVPSVGKRRKPTPNLKQFV